MLTGAIAVFLVVVALIGMGLKVWLGKGEFRGGCCSGSDACSACGVSSSSSVCGCSCPCTLEGERGKQAMVAGSEGKSAGVMRPLEEGESAC